MGDNFFDNWTTQFRKGVLELCVLNAIREEQLYGYEIVKRLRAIDGLMIREGTIYPMLSRFSREDLVRARIQESQEGPPRKYYQLTERGQMQLAEMNAYWATLKEGIQGMATEAEK